MTEHRNGNDNEHLDDHDLLLREDSERREYRRLRERDPHAGRTRYGVANVSRAVLHAWERWNMTRVAVRLRGLVPRVRAHHTGEELK
jgi:hypothetical protein